MQIHYGFDDLKIKSAVVTTGSFDGVHVGHQVIINRLNKLAKEVSGESVLITFHPHPRKVLYPDTLGKDLKLINSQEEKLELLKQTGLDHLIVLNFTQEFSKTSSYDFVSKILLNKLNAKVIVVGFNHHFGHNRQGDYNYLYNLKAEFDFEVEEIEEQDIQNETVSSTKIRKALKEGKIQRANAYLDHQYIVNGILQNKLINKYLSFQIQITDETKLLPLNGSYAVSILGKGFNHKALAIVNMNNNCQLTLYLLDSDCDTIKEVKVSIYFHKEIVTKIMSEDKVQNDRSFDREIALVKELIY